MLSYVLKNTILFVTPTENMLSCPRGNYTNNINDLSWSKHAIKPNEIGDTGSDFEF